MKCEGAISARLKQERCRLEMIQIDAAKAAGVSYGSYFSYEKGTCFPNAEVLSNLYAAGFDVTYIITGKRDDSKLSPEAHTFLNQFQQLDPRGQRLALGVMQQIHQNLSE
ncbi:helix-turn-helix domain-containing protein [Chromobacterium haemolyticum]|uniref:helix-turn-helix domain-containing protein n=1 Tax=Chromobacterium haemolyticum TaxID=394935 RepID=UPI000685A597|nr:helix-turn-helix transcriptional regulator [Chromobacterium haemolyticum]